eukprot:TRINITY_DN770_c0_g2_i1.p1 TRINITY_DN770_c0_g2~~TRINITY_DN770_c0_g2_i1.p1  ORF type:complete len:196 (-),score=49.05 TRINITY_DN770_c0_g2_i1:64-651(-)
MADEDASSTPGYQIGEKKSVEEYEKMDADDKSLAEYKRKLLGDPKDLGDPNDPRLVIITKMTVITEDKARDDIVYSFAEKGSEKQLKDKSFTLKENCKYKIEIQFKCQHEIITGLKLINLVYKKSIRVHKEEIMLGSFSPSGKELRTVVIPRRDWEEAPGGLLGRGSYKGKHRFLDDDGKCHLEYDYAFTIAKSW